MTRELNLNDIQGNVVRAYGRYSFPFARYFFFHIKNPAAGRKFVDEVRQQVTSAARWPSNPGDELKPGMQPKPFVTTNIGFTFFGLYRLEVPYRTLQGMPDVFTEGMRARAYMLGDRDQTKTEAEDPHWDKDWDKIWQDNRDLGTAGTTDVHIWVSINAQPASALEPSVPHPEFEARTKWLIGLADNSNDGVELMRTNGRSGKDPYQDASAVFDQFGELTLPTAKEHFGFTDGIGDPVFKGQYPPDKEAIAVIGRGKRMGDKWEPLATGEFILGHPDESQELPPAARPFEFTHNGTFMAYRKLHENVGSFDEVVNEEAADYAKLNGLAHEEAREIILAKMCGRWSDGVPLSVIPDYDDWIAFGQSNGWRDGDGKLLKTYEGWEKNLHYIRTPHASDFRYADDMAGYKCPLGAHLRRVNTRDYLDPLNKVAVDPRSGKQATNAKATTALNKRRRILRRGLPYGPSNFDNKSDETEQGVIMLIMGASLFRQFEFVQQQWIQYSLDFHQGNATCPMLGDHRHHTRHMIPADPKGKTKPFMMNRLKTFVECRGGDYFFVPSLVALRMIGMGIVDPT